MNTKKYFTIYLDNNKIKTIEHDTKGQVSKFWCDNNSILPMKGYTNGIFDEITDNYEEELAKIPNGIAQETQIINSLNINTVLLKVIIKDKYFDYNEALKDLINQEVQHLGWLNGGIKLPKDATFTHVFSNRSGSNCLYCDITRRIAYSVDMGD